MRVMILGADGYLGWPTAMYFSHSNHEVAVLDNFAKRHWELELGIRPLVPIPPLHERTREWKRITGRTMQLYVADLTDYRALDAALVDFRPHAIIHYGEQPSAPYSMIDHTHAGFTQWNNVIGTLNVLFAMREVVPECHLVKLGTMGEYGTPNIDIEEGWIDIVHNGRSDRLPFPKVPGSFYHLSKVHDSNNIMFACRVWGLRATDLNQGVVYGLETQETELSPDLATSFHYDECFGTVLNRFCVQAVLGHPLTLYGAAGQTRGFLNLKDTLQCVELATLHPAEAGEFRVFNQFTEQFSVGELARLVCDAGRDIGLTVRVENVDNPRVESENHYYSAKNTKLVDLGLRPHALTSNVIAAMLRQIQPFEGCVIPTLIRPRIRWLPGSTRGRVGASGLTGGPQGGNAASSGERQQPATASDLSAPTSPPEHTSH